MPDLEIVIRTRAELEGARQAITAIEQEIGQAKALGRDYSALEARAQAVRKAIGDHQAGSGQTGWIGSIRNTIAEIVPGFARLDSVLGKLVSGPLSLLGAGFGAIAVGFKAAKNAIDEWAQAEVQFAKLDTALAQTGQLTDAYRQQLHDLAGELQAATAISDDQWLAVLTKLTQFGADSSNIYRVTDAVKNLAGILGGDLNSAASMVSRALQGSFEMFGRYGIIIGDAGTQTEKLDRLFQQLALRGGGQLEAQTKTLTGAWQDLKNKMSDVLESIGLGISKTGILQSVLSAASNTAEWWAEALQGAIPQVEGLSNAAAKTTQQVEDAARAQEAYNAVLESTVQKAREVATAIDKEREAIQAKKRAQDEEANARMALDLARTDFEEKARIISPDQAISKRHSIRERYAKEAHDRNVDVLDRTIGLEQQRRTQWETLDAEMVQKIGVQESRAAHAEAIEAEKAKMERLDLEIAKNRKALEEIDHKQQRKAGSGGFATFMPDPALEEERARIKDAIKRQEYLRERAYGEAGMLEATGPEDLGSAALERGAAGTLHRQRLEHQKAFEAGASKDIEYNNQARSEIDQRNRIYAIQRDTNIFRFAADHINQNTPAIGQAYARANDRANQLAEAIRSGDPVNGINAMGEAVIRKFSEFGRAIDSINQRIARIDMRSGELRNQ